MFSLRWISFGCAWKFILTCDCKCFTRCLHSVALYCSQGEDNSQPHVYPVTCSSNIELFIYYFIIGYITKCSMWYAGVHYFRTAGWIWKHTVCTVDTLTRMYRAYCMFPYLAHWTRLNCQLQLCCCILHASCNRHWKVRVNNQYALSLLTIRYQILSACPPIGIAFPAVLRTQSSGC